MADNENKVNGENTQKGGRRPYRGGHGGKGRHGRPHHHNNENKPAPAVEKEEGAHGVKEERVQRSPKPHGRQENRPHHSHGKQEHRQSKQQTGERRKDEGKRREEQKPQRKEEKTVSPRTLLMQERQTADQKAFAEAKDIMLEAEKLKEQGVVTEEDDSPKVEIVGIRFKPSGKIYYFAPAGIQFEADEGVIVETARGQEYGYVALSNRMVKVSDTVQPLKEVIRKATEADAEKHKQNKLQEKHAAKVWEELVEKHKLVMSLTDIEYTFDNSKLIFYFTADGRVDFRELVKDLAAVFRTRIELRQIGVRDEAKLLGGLGVCGMPFCCNRFLPDFVQVSIKMAKEQNLSLSSSKISGNCGRLMCCLRYEQDVYEREYATFPRADMVVRTAVGTGVVAESNFINGKIKVRMDGDGTAVYKVFTRDEVKVIGKVKSRDNEPIDKELKALED